MGGLEAHPAVVDGIMISYINKGWKIEPTRFVAQIVTGHYSQVVTAFQGQSENIRPVVAHFHLTNLPR